ncbi:hypothetical protein BWI97_20865 [Siphonobacter sp. BAB-5405]|nr:hypothetical protein BWI97_20865 [Siphonobacter sp. BAB-5405]
MIQEDNPVASTAGTHLLVDPTISIRTAKFLKQFLAKGQKMALYVSLVRQNSVPAGEALVLYRPILFVVQLTFRFYKKSGIP